MRQLASPFVAPLVLDRGAVVSLPRSPLRYHPPCPQQQQQQGKPRYRNCRSGRDGGSPAGVVMDDFVVELSSDETAMVPGFPALIAAAAAAVEYAILACQEDVDQAVAGAVVGEDVFAAEVFGSPEAGMAGVEEDGGGVGVMLGGVEEQVSRVGEQWGEGRWCRAGVGVSTAEIIVYLRTLGCFSEVACIPLLCFFSYRCFSRAVVRIRSTRP